MLKSPRISLLAALAVLFIACSGEDPSDEPDAGEVDVNMAQPDADEPQPDADEPEPDADEPEPDADEPDAGEEEHPDHRTEDCDPLLPEYCSMPWPSNLYLEADEDRMTGYTLDFGLTTLPTNDAGDHVEPDPYRHLDGYGLGTPVAVLFPGVDLSQLPTEDAIEDSVEDDDRHAFYFEVTDDGLEAVPFWAELDVHAESAEEQVLYLRPAVVLEENARYVVGFRNLVDEAGNPFERSEAFDQYLSGEAADAEELAWRQERFDEIFDLLEDAGIERDELTLAWDFHTASTEGLHSDLLHVIETGLAAAEDEGIEVVLTDVTVHDTLSNPHIAYEIEGTFRVPRFLEPSERATSFAYRFYRDEDGRPAINDWGTPKFWLQIPHTAVDGTPHGLVKYGHGMLGRGSQVDGEFNQQIAYENQLIFFATDFAGFSQSDVPHAIDALQNPTLFEEISDRMHQGVLNYVLLTRAMQESLESIPDDPIWDDEELEDEQLELAVDHDRIFYSGISQGGIYGVTYVAVDPTITHGHFGVPGHNYSMLMERSSNYYGGDQLGYADFVALAFSDRVDQSMLIPTVLQLLWDKIDPISYLRRLTHQPFDEDMPKYGLFGLAKGDYQVAVVTKEITARSGIDIPILENYDREIGEPWGVDVVSYPHEGSGIVMYDFGNPWPHLGNHPPEDELGDPHGLPRELPEHNEQMIDFFDTQQIIDVCGGEPCYFPDAWDDD